MYVGRERRDGALRRPRTSQRDVPTNRKQGKRIGLRSNYFRSTAKLLLLISEGSPAWSGAFESRHSAFEDILLHTEAGESKRWSLAILAHLFHGIRYEFLALCTGSPNCSRQLVVLAGVIPLGGIVFAHLMLAMGTTGSHSAAIEAAMLKCETVEGLQRAIDNSSRRLLESARDEWERRFAGKDLRDACVSVRITGPDPAVQVQGVPGSGFVQTTTQSQRQRKSKPGLPRFAQ